MQDPSVLFAGYRVPHPLKNNIELKVQTDAETTPKKVFLFCCSFSLFYVHILYILSLFSFFLSLSLVVFVAVVVVVIVVGCFLLLFSVS